MTALRQRHVYATRDPNLRLIYRLNNELLGSRIQGAAVPAPGTALPISVEITDDNEPTAAYVIEVFLGPRRWTSRQRHANTHRLGYRQRHPHTVNGVTYQGGQQYVYLRVKQGGIDTAWTAPIWLEPLATTPPPPGGQPVMTLSLVVDRRAETAQINNTGTQAVNFTGWRLLSVRGNQVFNFPTGVTLAPGASVTVTSGPTAKVGTGFLLWTNENIWNNDGDPGRLLDADGTAVAETP